MRADKTFHYRGIQFEWDRSKAAKNILKHGIYFEEACEVFFDPFVKWLERQCHGTEKREKIIGETTRERLMIVIHATKNEEHVRIISARKATSKERKEYENP